MELEGTKIAGTAALRALAELAEQEGYERQLDARTLERLDPTGTHIVSVRPNLLPNAEVKAADVTHLNLTMATPLPCEIFIKPKGTMTMLRRMLDIPVYAYNELDDIPATYRSRQPRDGQRRIR